MVTENEGCYTDEIKKMLLGDPFVSVHVWKSSKLYQQYLKKIKEESGIEPKNGRWSDSEIKQLKENVQLYQKLNPNIDIIKLVYERRTIERTRIYKTTRFWDILAFKLCRILDRISASLTQHFRAKAGYKTGACSKHEHSYLKELVMKHGKDWTLISNLMNRSCNDLSRIYHLNIKNNVNKGPWKIYEKERLLYISKRLMQYNQRQGLPLYHINYRIVSDFVKTRNANACHNFTTKNKALLETLLVQNEFTLLMKQTMALYIYFSKVQSRNKIDFKELILLFDRKYTETELEEKLIKLVPVLTNDKLESQHLRKKFKQR